ncbi:MAG: HAD-IA family hydrolase [Halanaerobiaceae bacterium]|nr:HAD-IA family hydrolase [Halanaerobiaceae bacterium]
MIKAVIFDLDDTLYYELDYVKSGFRAVSRYISSKYGVSEEEFYQLQLDILEMEGLGKVFDLTLENFSLPLDEVERMLAVYRSHIPEGIQLYEDAEYILKKLKREKKYKTGIITDGNSLVQWNKIKALSLIDLVDEIIVTDDFGIDKRKPAPFAYLKLLETFQIQAGEAVYIGDNPLKDFIGARKLGMKTIRVLREEGMHIEKRMIAEYEADKEIYSLYALKELLKFDVGEGKDA